MFEVKYFPVNREWRRNKLSWKLYYIIMTYILNVDWLTTFSVIYLFFAGAKVSRQDHTMWKFMPQHPNFKN
jgi:hypothetical protein